MPTYALTGNDTFVLSTGVPRILKDFADGSTVNITRPNEMSGATTGKNGNTVFAANEQGRNAEIELRIIAGSGDDIYLNGLLIQQKRDLPAFPLLNGAFSKRIGDGQGNVKFSNYALLGGVFRQDIEASENLQGETEQGIAVYRLFFANAERSIG